MKTFIKRLLFGKSKTDFYTIKAGIAKGLRVLANPQHKTYLLLGLYEAEIQGYFKKYAQKCNIMLDIGAADGYYSLVYRKFNSEGKIILCDAGASRFKELQLENFRQNKFETNNLQQETKLIGIGDASEFISIDEICQNFTKQNILFKIDVDGYELDVLKSALKTFERNNCYFVVETHTYKLEADCLKLLNELGFTTKIIYNGWYRCIFKDERPIEMNRWFVAAKGSL